MKNVQSTQGYCTVSVTPGASQFLFNSKIQMRKTIFAFFEEKNKNILKRVNRKLKLRPEMKSSWKNKSVIFFCFPKYFVGAEK